MSKPTGQKSTSSTCKIEDFTEDNRVKACLQQLHQKFGPDLNDFIVSDILDGQGHQYVNLVQKGGGVLGVALVGYTYILEKMGIRFLKLAGTSAGAINTALMTVIGNKEESKSEQVLRYICELDFFKLVDGHPVARWVIRNFIRHKNFAAKVRKWIIGIIATLVFLFIGDFVFLGIQGKFPSWAIVTRIFFVLTGFSLLLLVILVAYTITLIQRLKESGLGINPGDYFYDWMKDRMEENGVKNVTQLNKKAGDTIPGLQLRPGVDHPKGIADLKGDVTFVASELVTQNKIKFPEMCDLFRHKTAIDELHPAGFVRASMAIPIFFESFFIDRIPCDKADIKKVWMERCNEEDPPETARFVDGGILSNFPIDIFYKSDISTPRLPVFGIDLDDSEPRDKTKHAFSWSFYGYFGRVFNTIRFYYDKDFLLKNKMFKRGIGKVPLAGYNWLNFFLKPTEMRDMFAIGAKAATDFLAGTVTLPGFDWKEYKVERRKYHLELLEGKKTDIE